MGEGEREHLLDEIARRDKRIALLEQKVDALVRRLFGTKSEALDPAQLELLLNPDTVKKPEATGADDAPVAECSAKPRQARAERKPRVPDDLPVEEQVVDPLAVQADPEAWRCIGSERREQLDYRPGRFIKRVLVRRKFVRKDDPQAKPVIAPLPVCLQERCIAAPGLIAEVVVNKYAHHLPLDRQEKIFMQRHGVHLPRKTLCGWTLLASDWLSAIYREIEYEHGRGSYQQVDETPVSYLEPGHGKARQGYLWVSHLPGGSVLYQWHPGRGHEHLDALLGAENRPRVVQCDGYSAYKTWAAKRGSVTLAGCHAHMRRKFFEAKEQDPKLVAWILGQIGQLYRIEKELRRMRAGPVLREAIRSSSSRMIHRRLKRCFDMLARRRGLLPKSLLGMAVGYALKQWDALEVCLTDGRIELDTNLVENAMRPAKLGAKNWLFIGSEESGAKTAILYTLIENCRRLKIDPRDYLEDALTRLPAMKIQDAWMLTPANWQRSRRGKPLQRAA
jgi:transposase